MPSHERAREGERAIMALDAPSWVMTDAAARRPSWPMRLGHLARAKPVGTLSAVIVVATVVAAVFSPQVAPYDPYQIQRGAAFASPGSQFWLGGDEIGRDQLSRIIYGARISLLVGVMAVGIAILIGTVLGLVSGFWGGKVDIVIQRLVDSMMAFPGLLLALLIIAVLGPSIVNVMVAIGLVRIPQAARVVRSSVLAVKQNPYVEAARTIGCHDWRIITHHLLPNVTAPIIILATVDLGGAIIAEASLSFLGLGTQLPTPSWGNMLNASQLYLLRAPWLAIFPGLAITLLVLAFNLLGDVLRDVWDPRLRGSR